MLLAFGVALRLGGRPSFGDGRAELVWVVVIKMLLMPAPAWVGGLALGLDRAALFAATVIAALPMAQNVSVHFVRYDMGLRIAKDNLHHDHRVGAGDSGDCGAARLGSRGRPT